MLNYYKIDFCVGKIRCKLIEFNSKNIISDSEHKYYQHCHQGIEIYYVEKGCYEVMNSKKSFHIHEGQLLLIPSKTYHQILPLTEGASRITLFVEMMLPDYKCDKSDIRFYKAFQQEDFSVFNTEATEIRQVLVYIKNILESEMNYLKREKMRVFATILLINIFEQLFPDNNTKMTIKSSELPSPEETLNNFFAFSFMSNSSHKDLANKLHVSPRQLHRIMKKTYNINYRQKLKEVRLEIAINFLRNTDNSIAEISNILGYSSSANFSTFIKTSTGKTPSQIRKENQTLGNITCHRQI